MTDAAVDDRTRRMLGVLGMAHGAGATVCGHEKIRAGFRKQPPVLLIAASDASANEADRLLRRFPGVPVLRLFNAEQLSRAVGRDHAVFIGMKPHGLSEVLRRQTVESMPEAAQNTEPMPND